MTTLYVASRSGQPERALLESNVIEICESGPDPFGDAQQYCKDETYATEQETYIYAVEVSKPLRGFKIYKEVSSFVPAK